MKKDDNKREIYFKNIFGNDFDFEAHKQTKNFPNRDRVKNALDKAWEVRDFEIDLYWKRATYFWLFIASIFAGFFLVLGDTDLEQNLNFIKLSTDNIVLLIAALGVIFSLAWVCVNKGSKFWQENWEEHIYNLEIEYYGYLYSTPSPKLFNKTTFSVSKVNLIISYFVLAVWGLIFLSCLYMTNIFKLVKVINFSTIFSLSILVLVLLFIILLFTYARTVHK